MNTVEGSIRVGSAEFRTETDERLQKINLAVANVLSYPLAPQSIDSSSLPLLFAQASAWPKRIHSIQFPDTFYYQIGLVRHSVKLNLVDLMAQGVIQTSIKEDQKSNAKPRFYVGQLDFAAALALGIVDNMLSVKKSGADKMAYRMQADLHRVVDEIDAILPDDHILRSSIHKPTGERNVKIISNKVATSEGRQEVGELQLDEALSQLREYLEGRRENYLVSTFPTEVTLIELFGN